MPFTLPEYVLPDFRRPPLVAAPPARLAPAPADGIAPEGFHATSNYPEYVHRGAGRWLLAAKSRMDCLLVLEDEVLQVVEARRVRAGAQVVLGRGETGEEGVYVHSSGFLPPPEQGERFAFRTRETRETPCSASYDELYALLRHERAAGHIVWVLGPAVAFDRDSRAAMQGLIEQGYCQGLLAGNALATHDLEAGRFGTGLGQDIYTRLLQPQGHYHHLDILNTVRRCGSLAAALPVLGVHDGIMHACVQHRIPWVLAGSIRDDGPLPEVLSDVCQAQEAMRSQLSQATTVLALATQLHAIAAGNLTPSYQVRADGSVRPVYFYVVDMSEFGVAKLANRGSGQARAILTNVQDFVVNLWHALKE